MQVLRSMNVRGRLILGGCALAFLVVAVLVVRMASAPTSTQVVAGVDPAQTAKITAALDAQGIAYTVGNGGTEVSVGSSDLSSARVAMATAGVSATAKQPGYELLDKQKLGTSNLQQQIAYQRALEGQIANTIGEIDAVGSAQVSLTLPKEDLFSDDATKPTAAVLLGSTDVDPNAVRGIASLVANSVQGLKPDGVTITDSAGSVLWPTSEAATGGGGLSKISAQQRYDSRLESQLNGMLTSTLGANQATAQVTSDLDVDDTTKQALVYGKRGTPTKVSKQQESLKGAGAGAAAGAAGTASNVATYAAGAAGGSGDSNYKRTETTQDVALDKEVTTTKVAAGAVRKLSVGLVVNSKLPPAVQAAAQKAVAGAVGLPTGQVSLSSMPFAAVATPKPAGGPVPAGIVGPLKTGGLVLAALLFAFFLARGLRKRESTAFAEEPSWLRELALPAPVSHLEEAPTMVHPVAAAPRDPNAVTAEGLADNDPASVALQLRGWMAEDAR